MEVKEYIDHIMKKHDLEKTAAVDHAAQSLGVTRPAIFHWLNGTRKTPATAKKLMELLVRIKEA